MFGYGHTTGRDHQRGSSRDIIGSSTVAAGSHSINGAGRGVDGNGLVAHDSRRAGDLFDGFAAHPQRHQEATHLGRRGVT